jgi:hypothetical protein
MQNTFLIDRDGLCRRVPVDKMGSTFRGGVHLPVYNTGNRCLYPEMDATSEGGAHRFGEVISSTILTKIHLRFKLLF